MNENHFKIWAHMNTIDAMSKKKKKKRQTMPLFLKTINLFFLSTDNEFGFNVSPPKQHTVTFKLDAEVEPTLKSSTSPVAKSPRLGELK